MGFKASAFHVLRFAKVRFTLLHHTIRSSLESADIKYLDQIERKKKLFLLEYKVSLLLFMFTVSKLAVLQMFNFLIKFTNWLSANCAIIKSFHFGIPHAQKNSYYIPQADSHY